MVSVRRLIAVGGSAVLLLGLIVNGMDSVPRIEIEFKPVVYELPAIPDINLLAMEPAAVVRSKERMPLSAKLVGRSVMEPLSLPRAKRAGPKKGGGGKPPYIRPA